MFRKLTALAIIVIGLAMWQDALALEWEAGGGQIYAGKAPDGDYYQERFRHELKLQAEIYTLGITDKFKTRVFGKDIRWRAFGVKIDGFRGDSDAVQDENYAPRSATGCVPSGCGVFSRYQSELSTLGVAGTLAVELPTPWAPFGKPLIVSPEIGYHLYIPRMNEGVYSLDGRDPSASDREYHYKWGWNGGEVYGIGADWGNWRLSMRRFKINMANRTTDTGQHSWMTDIPSPVSEAMTAFMLSYRGNLF